MFICGKKKHNPFFTRACEQRQPTLHGFGLVEIIIATAIIGATFFALAGVSQIAFRVVRQSTENARANFLLEEGLEAIRILRDTSWSANIASSTTAGITYYPTYSTTTDMWALSTTNPGAIDGFFTRAVNFNDVYRRNTDDDIVTATSTDPKTLDAGTREVTITVSWKIAIATSSVKLTTYITDIFQN
jgi:Tfp pilus assembly protein PilV